MTNCNFRATALIGALAAAGSVACANAGAADIAEATAYDAPVSLSLNFSYHTEAEMAEQDIFIERAPGSGEVWRVTKADQNWSAPLYRSAESIAPAPFEADALGPFPKGEPLGMTLGEWFAGEGQGTYTCEDGRGRLSLEFTNMAPNGVYTVWHAFMAMPPTEPFIGTYDLPLGSRDGSQSVFVTDDQGHARFDREFRPCLQLTGEHLASMLAVTLHSDGKTYGPEPGEFGSNSHVQMFVTLPKRTGL